MLQPQHVLSAAQRPFSSGRALPAHHRRLLLAGAGGAMGAQMLHGLVASGLFAQTDVLTSAPVTMALPGVGYLQAPAPVQLVDWPAPAAPYDTAVVMFEPPQSFNDRERALLTPTPEQLPALAAWLHTSGVQTLVVVLPHATGRLPDALKRGLASLDEQAVASLGFERVLLVRSAVSAAQQQQLAPGNHPLEKLARWMLSITSYMVPANEQPVRPARVAEFVEAALRVLPPGTFVATTDVLHRASPAVRSNGQSAPTMTQVVHDWLADKVAAPERADAPPA
jgi:hypothetical protein